MKILAELPQDDVSFIDQLVRDGAFPSRSAVLIEAISLMKTRQLVAEYTSAFTDDFSEWDVTTADGLFPRN
jgi:Arc/MetJ-type ribon-helix-helix transcriptional regulator